MHYGHNSVSGSAPAGALVIVLVLDNLANPVDQAAVIAGGDGRFSVECHNWDLGECPDIVPGYRVHALSGGEATVLEPIGAIIQDEIDAANDTVSGRIIVPWLPYPIPVTCEVWEELGPPPVMTTANPPDGAFTCDFTNVGWDLQRGQHVALRYMDLNNNSVINSGVWPMIRVNIAHDWVGGNFPAGHDLAVDVRTALDDPKATASISSTWGGGWGTDGFQTDGPNWSPDVPDIIPGDRVSVVSGTGYTHTLTVGEIDAVVDANANNVMGLIYTDFDVLLDVECHPWGAWEAGIDAPVKTTLAPPDGFMPFGCAWDPVTEWDVQPGQEIAVIYFEPEGHAVMDVFAEPVPHLRIDKRAHGEPAEGGNLRYEIEVWNDGGMLAQNVTVTDTMQGLVYLADTLMGTPTGSGSGPIVWNLGSLAPESSVRFDLFAQVTAAAGQHVTNTITVGTTTPGDEGEPWEKTATRESQVQANNTQLSAGIWTSVQDPAAGKTFVLAGNVCNQGSTASDEVVLTAQFAPPLSLVTWWADNAGWQEVAYSAGELVVALPSMDNWACQDVSIRAEVDASAQVGDPVTATVSIASDSDLSPSDNEAEWHGEVGAPRVNLFVNKQFDGGQLVPGGNLRYLIEYGNTGNTAVGPVLVTDTLPLDATYLGAWSHGPGGSTPFEPTTVGDGYLVWEMDELEGGSYASLQLVVSSDPGASPGDVLTNTVEISAFPGEETLADNAAEAVEVLYGNGPNLRITKSARWHSDAVIGYAIQFFNVGNEQVADVAITDMLPGGTTFGGDWRMDFDPERLVAFDPDTLTWELSALYPGDAGRLNLFVDVDEPGLPGQWYTNTVAITLPAGDPSPDDNSADAGLFSGGEVPRVELWLNLRDPSNIWGQAQAGSAVTVTTPITQVYAWADPACGGCWDIRDAGMIEPGDIITVAAGLGQISVQLTVPDPLDAAADATANEVWGEIGGLAEHPVEIHGQWTGGYQQTATDASGAFRVSYDDVPRGGHGYIRYEDMADDTEVVWHRPFETADLILQVNYAHNWINSPYEVGHTGWFTVTASDGTTIKATAEMQSQTIPWWGGDFGFDTTLGDPWVPAAPDLQLGDWVYAQVEDGPSAAVQVGEISAELDLPGDAVSGTITVPGVGAGVTLDGWCAVRKAGGPQVAFAFDADGGAFACDLGAAGWDLRLGETVAVGYTVPDGDQVITILGDEPLMVIYMPLAIGGPGSR